MNKLYTKNELLFAIVWIIVYIVGTIIFDNIATALKITNFLTPLFYILLCSILLIWIIKNKINTKFGLCKSPFSAKYFLFYIPLLILISTNFWFGASLNYGIVESILNVLSMLCVGLVEEIIFRGFLFKSLEKDNKNSAIIISSVTFGIGHLINLFSTGLDNLLPNICQVFYAIAVGFLFVIIFYKGGSLISCILTHSLVNAFSVFQNISALNIYTEIITSIAIIYNH